MCTTFQVTLLIGFNQEDSVILITIKTILLLDIAPRHLLGPEVGSFSCLNSDLQWFKTSIRGQCNIALELSKLAKAQGNLLSL